ncbi:uncharacterized protein LOC116303720 [Actinia tenebrosa]|uniref:Uncharacterized protein LOC116289926 n=1 Tax=Actinia tenebrosa TaxID=6105 RepID=A0A6P8IQG2_ACTTE|nr:uncharacterized protein LOC116289926 [Actinia tenebrosa]XP_031569169.1 uncharacterized protein LOC116303720 [Actinia tenebrosa]
MSTEKANAPSDITKDPSAVKDLIIPLSDSVEEKKENDKTPKLRIYRTSEVIEQDGILEQAIFVFPSVVSLNVGGYHYHSTSYTLTQFSESRLAKMCNGIIPLAKDPRGNIFIDRDGATFRYILSFLRSRKLKLPLNFKEFDELESEAEYYEIEPLVEALKKEKSKYVKQNFNLRLSCSKEGAVLAGEVNNLVNIIPNIENLGGRLNTGEGFEFLTGDKVTKGAQMEFPLKSSQVDALVQHILKCGYEIKGTHFAFDDSEKQTWIFEKKNI